MAGIGMEITSNGSSAPCLGIAPGVKTYIRCRDLSSVLSSPSKTFTGRIGIADLKEGESATKHSSPFEKIVSMIAGIVKGTVSDVRVTLPGLEGVSHFPVRKEGITEQLSINSRRERSSSQWCSSSLLDYWNRCGAVRMLSTKSRDGDGNSRSSSDEEKTETKEEVPARPKSINDFQHEEIVGPTVERDESHTANQLRASLGELTTLMTNLRKGFMLLGTVQMLALLWTSAFHGVGFFLGLFQDFSLVMSFVFAYLLRVFGSRVEFFSKIEGRSRMRILTLALQANRMLNLFFFRSTFVVKAVALCSVLALLVDIWHSQLSNL